ncbi:hypothetical protein [Streptomyces sp. NBC_00269]
MVARLRAAFPSVDAVTVEATVRTAYDLFLPASSAWRQSSTPYVSWAASRSWYFFNRSHYEEVLVVRVHPEMAISPRLGSRWT